MPASTRRRAVALALAGVFSACSSGGSSPTRPEMPTVTIPTGAQVLRVTSASQCAAEGRPVFLVIYARVTVARIGNEWTATATTPESGTVELRFHQSRAVVVGSSMPVSGTIRGMVIHVPDLAPGPPMTNARVNFGADAGSILDGFAFAPSTLTPVAGVSGVGSGTITLTDSEGHSCAGSTFMWGLGPHP